MGSTLSKRRRTETLVKTRNGTEPNNQPQPQAPEDQDSADDDQHIDPALASSSQLKVVVSNKTVIERMLECPICMDICIPPIFQCEIGHHICEKCKLQLSKCPSCCAEYRGTRNFFLEKYFEDNCSFSCQFAKDGCKEIVAGKDLKDHHEKCDFRHVPCFWCKGLEIDNLIPFSEYLEHLINSHQGIHYKGQDGFLKYSIDWLDRFLNTDSPDEMILWDPDIFEFQGFKFVATIVLHQLNLGIWVSIVGSEEQANQFEVEIVIERNNSGKKNAPENVSKSPLVWKGQVFPHQTSWSSMWEESACMLTSIELIHSICESADGTESGLQWSLQYKLIKKN